MNLRNAGHTGSRMHDEFLPAAYFSGYFFAWYFLLLFLYI
jgi:hypothetical protein